MILSEKEVHNLLELYKKEYRLIENVNYEKGSINASLIPFRYNYTSEDLDYLTATQLNLYLSQLTYILIGTAIKDKKFTELSPQLYETFITNMYKGRLFFVRIDQRIKKMIRKESNIYVSIKIIKIRKIKKTIFAKIGFSFCGKSSQGELIIGMKLED